MTMKFESPISYINSIAPRRVSMKACASLHAFLVIRISFYACGVSFMAPLFEQTGVSTFVAFFPIVVLFIFHFICLLIYLFIWRVLVR